jgi:hypothetical protein
MELETARAAQPGGLKMAAISRVQTLSLVAKMLGEDEELLSDLLLELEPEDGVIWVYDGDDRQCEALTDFGIENLKAVLAEYKENIAGTDKPDTGCG